MISVIVNSKSVNVQSSDIVTIKVTTLNPKVKLVSSRKRGY